MNENLLETLDKQLSQLSQELPYPPTPDIAAAVASHLEDEKSRPPRQLSPRLAWVVVILILLATLMAIEPVRAQILEFLQVGAIRIFLNQPDPTIPPGGAQPSPMAGVSIPTATPVAFPVLDELAGETSLEGARSAIGFPIKLPTYPPALGEPDRVFLQDLGGQAVLLVWMDEDDPGSIQLDLLIMGPGTFAEKGLPEVIEETSVNGLRAIWTQGEHILHFGGTTYQSVPLVVQGNILVWEQDGITYRLESDLPLEEAVRLAESLDEQ
jgi:hypothetical protein